MDIQSNRPATAPGGNKYISRPGERFRDEIGHLLGRSQGSRLGSTVDDIPDGIMSRDPVSVAPTSDLVISKRVNCVIICGLCRQRIINNAHAKKLNAKIFCAKFSRFNGR